MQKPSYRFAGFSVFADGKGGKTRMVLIGRKTRRAMRAYVRLRHDSSPALFVTKGEEHATCDRLQLLLEQRVKRAKFSNKPAQHGFRHAFAINMLCSVLDIFVFHRVREYFLGLEDRCDVSGKFRLLA